MNCAKTLIAISAITLTGALAGCDREEKPEGSKYPEPAATFTVDPGATEPQPVTRAIALLHPTQGNEARGTVTFSAADQGVKVEARVSGLTPGKHAYHVHLLGDCSAPDGTSAGTHFNFSGSSKNPPADIQRITGNLGELQAGENGRATATATIEDAHLQGPFSIIGRSVVVHAQANDPQSPPIGAAGARVACGVIGITE